MDELFHLLCSAWQQKGQSILPATILLSTHAMETAASNWLISSKCIKILPIYDKEQEEEQQLPVGGQTDVCFPFSITPSLTV